MLALTKPLRNPETPQVVKDITERHVMILQATISCATEIIMLLNFELKLLALQLPCLLSIYLYFIRKNIFTCLINQIFTAYYNVLKKKTGKKLLQHKKKKGENKC